jgi:ribosome biogenesis GTPase
VADSLSPERLNSWHKLQREAQRDTMKALERQRQLSEWKQRSQAGRQRLKDKRQGV